MNRSIALMFMALGVTVGCGGADVSESTPPPSGSGSGSGSGSSSLSASIDKDQTLSGDIDLPATATIAPGVTLTLAAGAKLHASKGASLLVKGTLVAAGDSGAPVVFEADEHGTAGAWTGIVVQSGGKATLTHAEIHDASLAFEANESSSYALDFVLIDSSEQLASLSANGTIQHSQFHGLGDSQSKSPFAVSSASPQVSDTVIDKGKTGGVDLIVVDGPSSAPVFDHVEVANAHCVFHFNEAKNAKITNSFIHDSSYGMMVVGALGMVVQGNNFEKNNINIGTCVSGDVSAAGNYYGGVDAFDSSCAGQKSTDPAAAKVSGAGPRP